MDDYTADFSLDVQGVKGFCPAGEVYSKQQIAKKTIPVFSCEGPCIGAKLQELRRIWSREKSRRWRVRAMRKPSWFLILQWQRGSRAQIRPS
jgi:hypothetical protein